LSYIRAPRSPRLDDPIAQPPHASNQPVTARPAVA